MKQEFGSTIRIGNRDFLRSGKTYVMGILNLTPDSFSDGGQWNDRDRALRHVEEMVESGMDIVDVGGESTRPGCTPLSAEEEIARVVPVIEAIKSRFDVPVSLDTYKGSVAEVGRKAGADLINDIRGLRYDGRMAKVIAESGLPCCLMHNRQDSGDRKNGQGLGDRNYQQDSDGRKNGQGLDDDNLMQEIKTDLTETLRIAKEAGIADDRILLDPGIGFGKEYEENLALLRHLEQLRELGYPVLLGCSRKSVIGLALNLPTNERMEGTLVTTVMAVMKGCSFVRVHDVKENVRAVRMAEAILHGREPNK